MNVQWYPGHMTKTRRMIAANLKLVDLVVEIIDARIPISSRNPDLDELLGGKPRLIILNRADQADPAMNKAWSNYLRSDGASIRPPDRLQDRRRGEAVLAGGQEHFEGADRQVGGEGSGGTPRPCHGSGSAQRGQVHLYQ